MRPPVVPLRPLGGADILDGAVRLVRRHARAAFALSVPFAIVRAVLDAALNLATGSTLTQIGVLGGLVIAGGFGTILTGLLTPVFAGDLLGEQVPGRDALRRVGRRWWPLAVLAIAAALAENAGLATLVVGVWLWGVWAVAAPAMIVEGLGIRRSFGRSIELVRSMFWRTWGLRALGWVLTWVLGLFVELPFLVAAGVLADANPFDTSRSGTASGLYVAVSAIGTLLSVALVAPVTSAVEVLLYLDLRMRREGMDIVLALEPQPRAGTPSTVTAW
ncbi:hypothetical protein [uncultured Jatrophihabitans sp.]|uniref:hypothetical protein n=1 Tax=uncultured Jatrophihabitans sp. TaxID=1610747 RepID=UPI0035CB5124